MRPSPAPLLLAFLVASTAARAQEPVVDGAAADASLAPGAQAPAPRVGRSLDGGGRLGIALLGGGAALAASTAAATSLIEAVSRNDLDANAPPKNPDLVQVSGFVTVSLMSASVGVMLLGGALLANDLAD